MADTTKKIIRGVVNSRGFTITSPITQWDYGWQFIPEIDDLPPTYRLDFSNEEKHGTALPVYCGSEGAEVPTELIDTGKDILVWFVRIGEGYGITEYKWRIPNKCKPKTEQDEPTPSQQSSIDQLIVRSNEAVETAEQSASDADASAQSASQSADRAEQASDSANDYAERARQLAINASENASQASASATASAQSASQSAQIKVDVEDLADDAQGYAQSAEQSAQNAHTYALSANAASGTAENFADVASGYASQAQSSAQTASSKASEASQSASTASQKATESAQSASQALSYKNDAESAKTASQTAQELAENAESNAESTVHGVLDSLSLVETSGSIIETHDAFPVSPEKMVVDINPVQDLHGYDSPWVGGAGKNLCDTSQDNSIAYTSDYAHYSVEDGKVTTNGDALMGFIVPVKPSTTYTFSLKKATTNSCQLRVRLYSGLPTGWSDAFISQPVNYFVDVSLTSANVTFETTAETMYAVCGIYVTGTSLALSDFQVELGSTATDWTPYENICPISGWTGCEVNASGKNLFDNNTDNIHTFSVYNETEGDFVSVKGYKFDLPEGTYRVSASFIDTAETSYMFGGVFDADGYPVQFERLVNNKTLSPHTITVGENQKVCYYNGNRNQTMAVTKTMFARFNIQIEIGSTATEYEPYKGRIINVNWETEAGTVYGGTLDVLSGKLTVDRAMAMFDGTEPYINNYFPIVVCTKAFTKGVADGNSFVNSHLPTLNAACNYANNGKTTFQFGKVNEYWGVSSAVELKAIFAQQYANGTPVTICYPLAEPIEIQLTPQQITLFKDYNALWADTGDISEFAYRVGEFATKADIPNVPVEDVQVNGSSVVQNKIANIDLTGIEQNAEDIASLEEDRYKPYATDIANGRITSFVDGADDIPLKSLTVTLEPQQDLHGYDSPWVGGAGKNLFDQDTVYGAYKQSDGSFLMTGGNGVRFYIPQELVGKELTFSAYLKIPSGSTLTNTRVAVNVGGTASSGNYANTSEYTRSVKTFTPVSTDDRVYITYGSNGGQLLQAKDIQLEIGSTATDWTPYENICPISGWTGMEIRHNGINFFDGEMENGDINQYTGENNGTSSSRYRSKNYIPIRKGSYYFKSPNRTGTVRVFFYDKDKNFLWFTAWNVNAVNTFDSERTRYARFRFSTAKVDGDEQISINSPSSVTDYVPYVGRTILINWETEAGTVYGGTLDVLSGKLTVYPYYASYNGETLTGRWISDRDVYAVGTTPTIGAQVVNIGAEGTEYQLEPHEIASLLGANNIFADTGDTEVEYRADTKLYIERLTAPDSEDMIADANIVSGQYFMVGNTLYKATANIANGAQITVGTNCTRVSLAQALNEINS